MGRFGVVPREVPVESSLAGLAPRVAAAVTRIVARMEAEGHRPRVFETLRTIERQAFLYGFGRDYDDGRGIVTKVRDARRGMHYYGLAVDIVENDATPWTAPQAFWNALGAAAKAEGMAWGGNWKFLDLPHIQWGGAPTTPPASWAVMTPEAVWAKVGAL